MRIQETLPYSSLITEEIPIIASNEIEKGIRATPNVKAVYPFATRYAILKTKDDLQGILVKGSIKPMILITFGNL
ncbi:hypothetical protein LWM68_34265 [Niabella sp. W65]|nr:hypothetical protein [Niabella sp. W65]MCH7367381.1 hypothetical protein [Niabella sp. W65]